MYILTLYYQFVNQLNNLNNCLRFVVDTLNIYQVCRQFDGLISSRSADANPPPSTPFSPPFSGKTKAIELTVKVVGPTHVHAIWRFSEKPAIINNFA